MIYTGTAGAPNYCDMRDQFAGFQSKIYLRSTVFGLNGSNACYPLDAGNPTLTVDVPIVPGALIDQFEFTWFIPTDLIDNMRYFDIKVSPSLITKGSVTVTVTPINAPIPPGSEVRVTIIVAMAA